VGDGDPPLTNIIINNNKYNNKKIRGDLYFSLLLSGFNYINLLVSLYGVRYHFQAYEKLSNSNLLMS
jgi:hypothetical protein